MPPSASQRKAEEFLRVAEEFQLGNLPTEQRHPETHELAELARTNLPLALQILQAIDCAVLDQMTAREAELTRLTQAIRLVLAQGGRIFFYGCGATGRLSVAIEALWRLAQRERAEADQVRGFMSGGDLALVHSIENFEDHPEFGARQVREIGFREGDLLVACTEGGETPSVIGATEEATRLSRVKHFYLYCNPDKILRAQVERSRRVLDNPAIEKICLFVGPMSLSGSTRLQASTALQLGAGLALLSCVDAPPWSAGSLGLAPFSAFLRRYDFSFLAPFIEEESRIYERGDFLLYETNAYGLTILTDTTERAPTFSLLGFENQTNPARLPSLSYLAMPEACDAAAAWKAILLRDPRPLEWQELRAIAGRERLLGFDFSVQAVAQRELLVAPHQLHIFRIYREGADMCFELGTHSYRLRVEGLPPLLEQLLLKITLNMHSTLVMGRLGRFESNIMTWVKPSNNKLIDRSIRYVEHLLQREQLLDCSYEEIAYQLFAEAEQALANESVVLKTVAALRLRHSRRTP